jgi:hypothetical protein
MRAAGAGIGRHEISDLRILFCFNGASPQRNYGLQSRRKQGLTNAFSTRTAVSPPRAESRQSNQKGIAK